MSLVRHAPWAVMAFALTFVLLIGAPQSAYSDSTSSENDKTETSTPELSKSPDVSSDDRGVRIEFVSTNELFSIRRGGLNEGGATRYRGNMDLTFTFDLDRLGFWPGGTLFIYAQNGHGNGLSENHVGDIQTLSNIDARDFSQISEYWLEQQFFDKRLRVKGGKQDANADFAASDFGGEFLNSSFGLVPTVPLPTFPDPALGIAALADLEERFSLGAGVYDGASYGGTSGLDTAFGSGGSIFTVMEATYRPFGNDARFAGSYRLGVWYHSENLDELGFLHSPRTFSGNHGFYFIFDQVIYREQKSETQGIGIFGQIGRSPDNRNEFSDYYGGGLTYRGLIPRRTEDLVGTGIAHLRPGREFASLEDVSSETSIELFYRVQALSWIVVQPDLQYILNPGGNGSDALAVGLRLETSF